MKRCIGTGETKDVCPNPPNPPKTFFCDSCRKEHVATLKRKLDQITRETRELAR